MIVIFSYNRPDMLMDTLKSCPKDEHVVVMDDGSTYDATEHMKLCHYIRTQHYGKHGFWMKWQHAFDLCRISDDTYFTFISDDLHNIQWHRRAMLNGLYCQNMLTFKNRLREWTGLGGQECTFNGEPHHTVGYVDCAYNTNRETLERIGWIQPPVSWEWFRAGQNISSGVGHHQSWQYVRKSVPMYMPKITLANHGDHISMMHGEHRKEVPMIA